MREANLGFGQILGEFGRCRAAGDLDGQPPARRFAGGLGIGRFKHNAAKRRLALPAVPIGRSAATNHTQYEIVRGSQTQQPIDLLRLIEQRRRHAALEAIARQDTPKLLGREVALHVRGGSGEPTVSEAASVHESGGGVDAHGRNP